MTRQGQSLPKPYSATYDKAIRAEEPSRSGLMAANHPGEHWPGRSHPIARLMMMRKTSGASLEAHDSAALEEER